MNISPYRRHRGERHHIKCRHAVSGRGNVILTQSDSIRLNPIENVYSALSLRERIFWFPSIEHIWFKKGGLANGGDSKINIRKRIKMALMLSQELTTINVFSIRLACFKLKRKIAWAKEKTSTKNCIIKELIRHEEQNDPWKHHNQCGWDPHSEQKMTRKKKADIEVKVVMSYQIRYEFLYRQRLIRKEDYQY